MSSLEKEKKEERFTTQLTETHSKSVNKQEFVNNLLTKKFKSELQRVRRDQLDKINLIAEKHRRNSFPEVLDLLLFCYDYLEEVRKKYNLPGIASVIEYINENLPQSDADIIVKEVMSLLDKLNLNDPILEKTLISILIRVKLKGEDPNRFCRLLLGGV